MHREQVKAQGASAGIQRSTGPGIDLQHAHRLVRHQRVHAAQADQPEMLDQPRGRRFQIGLRAGRQPRRRGGTGKPEPPPRQPSAPLLAAAEHTRHTPCPDDQGRHRPARRATLPVPAAPARVAARGRTHMSAARPASALAQPEAAVAGSLQADLRVGDAEAGSGQGQLARILDPTHRGGIVPPQLAAGGELGQHAGQPLEPGPPDQGDRWRRQLGRGHEQRPPAQAPVPVDRHAPPRRRGLAHVQIGEGVERDRREARHSRRLRQRARRQGADQDRLSRRHAGAPPRTPRPRRHRGAAARRPSPPAARARS